MNELYINEGRAITEMDFINALQSVGIKKGDTIFVHSDIRVFGKIVIANKKTFLRSLVNALQDSIGNEGTVVMPTFSYSFCKNKEYDKLETHSTVGVLTDFFRTEEGVRRSSHPIFSVAARGKNADDFMRISKDSFGKGTVFETLRRLNGKIVFLGADFSACTFIHHIEQMHGVAYRFIKVFEGLVVDGKSKYRDSYTFFVRPLDGTAENDFSVIEQHLKSSGLLSDVAVGRGHIMSVSAKQLYNMGMKMLDTDPHCFIKDSAVRE